MLIECLIQRDGDSEIRLALSCYKFKKNKKGHAVCDVGNKQHSDYLLALGDDFKEYKEEIKGENNEETKNEKVDNPPAGLPLDEHIKALWESGERNNKAIAEKVGSIPLVVSQKIRKLNLR